MVVLYGHLTFVLLSMWMSVYVTACNVSSLYKEIVTLVSLFTKYLVLVFNFYTNISVISFIWLVILVIFLLPVFHACHHLIISMVFHKLNIIVPVSLARGKKM